MVDVTVVSQVRRYLRKVSQEGIAVSFGVIFGSQVRGGIDQWSDIDLVVVSPVFDVQINRNDVNRLWRIASGTDSRIEPVPCGLKQWQNDDSSAIIERARREGIAVEEA